MALSKAQRAAVTEVVRKLDKGPGRGWLDTSGLISKDLATMREVKLWSDSWIKEALQQVLDNDAGKITAGQLSRGY